MLKKLAHRILEWMKIKPKPFNNYFFFVAVINIRFQRQQHEIKIEVPYQSDNFTDAKMQLLDELEEATASAEVSVRTVYLTEKERKRLLDHMNGQK